MEDDVLTREHTTRLKPYNIIGPYILFTAGAAKLHDTMARRDSEDGARHTTRTPPAHKRRARTLSNSNYAGPLDLSFRPPSSPSHPTISRAFAKISHFLNLGTVLGTTTLDRCFSTRGVRQPPGG